MCQRLACLFNLLRRCRTIQNKNTKPRNALSLSSHDYLRNITKQQIDPHAINKCVYSKGIIFQYKRGNLIAHTLLTAEAKLLDFFPSFSSSSLFHFSRKYNYWEKDRKRETEKGKILNEIWKLKINKIYYRLWSDFDVRVRLVWWGFSVFTLRCSRTTQ